MPTNALARPFARTLSLAAAMSLATGCASSPVPSATQLCQGTLAAPHDPAESVNRGIFAFNRSIDDYLLAPVARGYRHLPGFVQGGVHNFVANFGEPKVLINDLLQGNGARSVTTVGRFAVNTTVGILGLIDVSGRMGIERHEADFGQTFGVWNIANGPIVELPLLGTGNLRDATGKVLGFAVSPFGNNSDALKTLSTVNTVGDIVDGRAEALPLTDDFRTQPDYYLALRDAVAERRAHFVAEGKLGEQPDLCGASDER
ncbi:VacJ family lipoprotein [Pseudomonas sp. PA27(2017)]|uniref:MlaA family lipoprotein n=1 Tax=Pseudomonas sp. PA27(2017) TaxID=1932112 RepID=UPI00096966A5|nr:VacJ family lipoprotein [Pseudomonas sp. PA27(2017)]OLU33846.1 ABC transporter [Pseudomonas sp. PA27(2017)]